MNYSPIDIKLIETRYEIYDNGMIFDKKRNKYCKKHLDSKGYHLVWIAMLQKNIRVHRLVLCKYNPIDNEYMYQVNHKDCNKTNNNLSNLEWCTRSENQKHALTNHLYNRVGENNSGNELTEAQVLQIIQLLLKGETTKAIAQQYNVCKSTISHIRNHQSWVYLTKNIDFPNSKYCNHVESTYLTQQDGLKTDLEHNIDIDILSKKYHLSKRYIRYFKYKTLKRY